MISFTLLLGIVFAAACLLFADPIMRLCGATEGNIEYLRPCYTIMSSFSIMNLLQSELGIFIIGEGRTVTAALVIMVGGVLNCALDDLFMAKRRMGVTVLFMNHLAFRCYGEQGVSALTVVIYVQVLIMLAFMGFTSAVEPVFSYHYGSGNGRMIKRVYRLPSGRHERRRRSADAGTHAGRDHAPETGYAGLELHFIRRAARSFLHICARKFMQAVCICFVFSIYFCASAG